MIYCRKIKIQIFRGEIQTIHNLTKYIIRNNLKKSTDIIDKNKIVLRIQCSR